jgi:hypothetical protein
MDNGKPIRESRDIDVPLVGRHFYHHAGWAQHLATRVPRPRALWRLRPDHPVELSAADAGLEDRAGAGRRQHGGAEAGRVHLADRAAVRRDLPRGGLPKGVVNIVTGDGDTGAAIVGIRASTRSPSPARPRSARSSAATPARQGPDAGARRQVALHRLRRRRSRQRRRRAGRCDLVQPGPGLLRRLAPPRAGGRPSASSPSSSAAWRRCASAIRSTRPSTSAPSSPRCSSSASRRW